MDKKAKYKVGDLVCCIGNEMILHEDTDEDVTDLEWGGYGHELGRSFIIHEIAIADEFHRFVY